MSTGSFRTAIAQLSLELSKKSLKRNITRRFIKNTAKIVHDIVLLCHRIAKEEHRETNSKKPEGADVSFELLPASIHIKQAEPAKSQNEVEISKVYVDSTTNQVIEDWDQFFESIFDSEQSNHQQSVTN